jgi:hypothetical protein
LNGTIAAMTRRHPISYLDRQVLIAFPNPVVRRILGVVVGVVGASLLAFFGLIGLFGLILLDWGLLAVSIAFGCLGCLLFGLGISGIRPRPAPSATYDQSLTTVA